MDGRQNLRPAGTHPDSASLEKRVSQHQSGIAVAESYISVEQNMIQVRIYLPDENASPIDRGGITRLSSARKQVVNVRLAQLPRALSSLPDGAWPYGRVVAIGKEKDTPQDRAWFPNHLDITVRTLQDMGVVVDDWNHPVALP